MHSLLIILAGWLLLGALPRMRDDAAAKLPKTRRQIRSNLTAHSVAARKDGRRKGGEWYGWAAVAAIVEGGAVGAYVARSAWRGWGDHRRTLLGTREAWRRGRAARAGDDDGAAVPPDGPDGTPPGGGQKGPAPSLPAPAAPGSPPAPWPSVPPPAPSNVRTLRPAGGSMTVATEAPNLEAALLVARQLITTCRAQSEAAAAELTAARAQSARGEQFGASLSAAGVGGRLADAVCDYADSVSSRIRAAEAGVAAADTALASAIRARDELRPYEASADALAANPGAAAATAWYTGKPA